MSSIEQVPAGEWKTWVTENDAAMVDVREPHEWDLGTLPDVIRLPMGEIPNRLGDLDADTAMLLVCRSGARSQQVANYLKFNGFRKVANLAGGMKALGMQD